IGATALFASSLRVEPGPEAAFGSRVVEGAKVAGPGSSAAPSQLRHYQGQLFVTVDDSDWQIRLINEVNVEDYVAAVISAEYGFDDLEGAKAMAVITRTYTLATLGKFGSEYDHVDHTMSQVYRGIDAVTPTMRRAVNDTRGQILSYDDELIEAVYFSVSGGHTADNEDVWRSKAIPYLRGKPDPYGTGSPHARWSSRVSRPRLLAALASAYRIPVSGFVISERSTDGRVLKVDLLREDGGRMGIRANEFRMAVLQNFGDKSLRSTHFEARRDGNEYVFEGSGYGHGVGLSQWGAHDLSLRGSSYREIIDFYYTGVKLETLADLNARKGRPEVASSKPKEEPRSRIGW
ncbi:MAG: SpoIID/LytB domain-containing protein, partial [Rhodothermales bacterium]